MTTQNDRRQGQALLLVVVMMSGVLFLVTAVAGLLMYYQLQQSNDTANSTVAIFAADAGIERALYYYFHEYTPGTCQFADDEAPSCKVAVDSPALDNGAVAEDIEIVIPNTADPVASARISANGKDEGRRTIRALETRFLLNR